MLKYAYIAAGIILILIGARLALMIKRWSLGRTLKRRRETGAQAEIDAIALIEKNGYKIIEEQSKIIKSLPKDIKKIKDDLGPIMKHFGFLKHQHPCESHVYFI